MKGKIYFLLIMLVAILSTGCKKTQKAMYEGMDISQDARIIRDKDTKAASLEINLEGKWKLYAGKSVESIDFTKPLLEGDGSGTYSLSVSNTERSYFELVTDQGKAILAEQHLPMTGGYNFRDLGGIKTKDNRYVKWGKIFRSDDLPNLTETDLVYLASIPINTVVDFRSQQEINMANDKLPENATYQQLSIEPGNIMGGVEDFDVENVDFDELMMEMNRLLVTDSSCVAQYRKFFETLQQENNIPLVYHCTAGKDRTGMASALILYALNVDDEMVMNNYMQSKPFVDEKYASYVQRMPNIAPLMTVKPQFLQAGIDQIRKDHGSVENYLTQTLNVDIQKMKNMFLY